MSGFDATRLRLIDRADRLEEMLERAESALRAYADPENWYAEDGNHRADRWAPAGPNGYRFAQLSLEEIARLRGAAQGGEGGRGGE